MDWPKRNLQESGDFSTGWTDGTWKPKKKRERHVPSETQGITRPIQDALMGAGYFCLRLNSGLIKSGSRYIRLCPAGTADLLLCPAEKLPIWIETKTLKGKTNKEQLEAQGAFREQVVRLGHQYVTARCLDDVLELLR